LHTPTTAYSIRRGHNKSVVFSGEPETLGGSFKCAFVPLNNGGKLEQVHVKVDSKGRLCIPSQIREEIGDNAILKKTSEGYLIIPGEPADFLEEFRKVISSEPKRKGKPKLISLKEMKSVWRTKA
jgi:bifunctional DNA-binding transcriptional regulator/antitoxin component of YhaV-PrlF toxin-antitoxin module